MYQYKEPVQLDAFESSRARDEGIERAVTSAETVDPNWKELAYDAFKQWLSGWPSGFCFQIEMFRASSFAMNIPRPLSDRAYGFIPSRAKKERLITNIGIKATRAVSAHRANAGYWQKL